MHFTLSAVLIIVISCVQTTGAGGSECSSLVGPAGINRCVLLNDNHSSPFYNDSQWATCLSNEYIKLLTGGRHQCPDRSAVYCWYQCMLETYNSSGPGVDGVCQCNSDVTYSTATPSESTISPMCYSPDGTDCSWYADCLEAKYPCRGTGAGYAIEYATKFCQLYDQHHGEFSALGLRWLAAAKKCLQVALVPLLRQYVIPTCDNIREKAFASHTPCYLNPGRGAPSICELPWSDFLAIIYTINSAFIDPTTASESICGALDVFRRCLNPSLSTSSCLRAFVIDVGIQNVTSSPPKNAVSALVAAKIVSKIAGILKWSSQELQFLGCLGDWQEPSRGLLNILVAVPDHVNCLKSLTSSTSKRTVRSVNLDDVEREFKNAVRNGSLLVRVDGVDIYVEALGVCDQLACSNITSLNIAAPPAPTVIASMVSVLCSTRFTVVISTAVLFRPLL